MPISRPGVPTTRPNDIVDALWSAGVCVAEAVAPRSIMGNPQLAARGYFETVDHPIVGADPAPRLPGPPGPP